MNLRKVITSGIAGLTILTSGCFNSDTVRNELIPQIEQMDVAPETAPLYTVEELWEARFDLEVGDRVIVEGVIKDIFFETWVMEGGIIVWINFRCEPLPDDVWIPGNPCTITPNNHVFVGETIRAEGIIKKTGEFMIEIDDGNNLLEVNR